MKPKTINISFQKDLLLKIDFLAREESRSRSELIREAARMYIERKLKWQHIFSFGDDQRVKQKVKLADINKEIAQYRNK